MRTYTKREKRKRIKQMWEKSSHLGKYESSLYLYFFKFSVSLNCFQNKVIKNKCIRQFHNQDLASLKTVILIKNCQRQYQKIKL